MYLTLFADLLIGVLAVFGLYTLLRVTVCARAVRVVLELPSGTTVQDLPYLLAQAKQAGFWASVRPVALLQGTESVPHPLTEALRAAGVEVYFIEK